MKLLIRWIAVVLLPFVLATSGGLDPGCGGSAHPAGSHHASHQPGGPTQGHAPQSCPMVPGASCTTAAGCLPTGAPPATLTSVAAPTRAHQRPTTVIPTLAPRAIAPDLPPPRA